jgi:hypothetical protein
MEDQNKIGSLFLMTCRFQGKFYGKRIGFGDIVSTRLKKGIRVGNTVFAEANAGPIFDPIDFIGEPITYGV